MRPITDNLFPVRSSAFQAGLDLAEFRRRSAPNSESCAPPSREAVSRLGSQRSAHVSDLKLKLPHALQDQLFASGLVLLEARRGDSEAAQARERVLAECAILEFSTSAQDLAQKILATRPIPGKTAADAAHIVIAAVHRMDFLLTWNCRHIASAAIVDDIRRACSDEGFPAPVICRRG